MLTLAGALLVLAKAEHVRGDGVDGGVAAGALRLLPHLDAHLLEDVRAGALPGGVAPPGGNAVDVGGGQSVEVLGVREAGGAQVGLRSAEVQLAAQLEEGGVAVDLCRVPLGRDEDLLYGDLHLGAVVLGAVVFA